MDTLIGIGVALFPIILFGILVYKSDKEREPLSLVFTLFTLGVLSGCAVLFINELLNIIFPDFFTKIYSNNASIIALLIKDFIIVATIEELFKWVIIFVFGYQSKEYNYTYDITVYSIFVALGFACFENLKYALAFGADTAVIRIFLGVPGHVCFAVMASLFLNYSKLTKHDDHRKKYLFYSLLVPIILHGVYDFTLSFDKGFVGLMFSVIFLVFVSILYSVAYINLKNIIDGDKRIV